MRQNLRCSLKKKLNGCSTQNCFILVDGTRRLDEKNVKFN